MHPFELSRDLIETVTARQGRAHHVETLDPARTALVVVDMQNYFMAPGQQMETPVARSIVPNDNRLAHALRSAGGRVVWIENTWPRDAREAWPSYRERHLPERWTNRQRSLTRGDTGFEPWPELEPDPADARVVKNRFSAFIQGSSDLEAKLRGWGIDTLLIAGPATEAKLISPEISACAVVVPDSISTAWTSNPYLRKKPLSWVTHNGAMFPEMEL